jgi:hypothetical protein
VGLTWTGVLSASGHGAGSGMKLEPRGKDMAVIVKIASIAAPGTPLRPAWAGSWKDETGRASRALHAAREMRGRW